MENASPQVWQEYKSGLVSAEIYKRWQLKADEGEKKIFIDPTPTSSQCTFECVDGQTVKIGLVFDYISNYPVQAANGTLKETFTADTDTFVLDDDLLELDVKWRYMQALAQDYAEARFEFERHFSVAKAHDLGPTTIRADGGKAFRYPNIPESGVGL